MKRLAAQHAVLVVAAHDPLGQKVDERVGLRVHVVAVEHDLGIVEDLAQTPYERMGVRGERLVGPERVEIDAVRLEGGIVVHVLERLRPESEPRVLPAVLVRERGGLVQEAKVGAFDVEAKRGHRALVAWEGLEDAAEQKLDGAGLGGQARDAGDVEVRGFGAEQEVAVQEHGRLEAPRRVETHRDAGGALASGVRVHAEREHHVLVRGEPDGAKRYRLHRLLGNLPQHRGGEKTDLGPLTGLQVRRGRVAVSADHRVHRGDQIGVREAVGDDAEDHPSGILDADDGPDADGGVSGRPEVELMRRGRFELGGHHPAERSHALGHVNNVSRQRANE